MPSSSLAQLRDATVQLQNRFSRQYPELVKARPTETQSSRQAPRARLQQLATALSSEEFFVVMQKLQAAAQLHSGSLDPELELYLEQQLADIFGFEITSEHQGHRLPHTLGVIQSLPHCKRTPTDTLAAHSRVPEAGFTPLRSVYGWMTPPEMSAEATTAREQYGLSLPLTADASTSSSSTVAWYKKQRLLVLNPFEYHAVIARVSDTYQPLSPKYQFGGTPELIRDGRCWSPQALGRVLVFFITDDSELPAGGIDCYPTQS